MPYSTPIYLQYLLQAKNNTATFLDVFKMPDCPTDMNLNSDLRLIRNWCFNNLLLLNPDKKKIIVFGSLQLLAKLPDFKISLLGKDLALASSAKDLWVVLDPQIIFEFDHRHVLKNYFILHVKPRTNQSG